MDPRDDRLRQDLAALERRVGHIERRLGIVEAPATPVQSGPVPESPPRDEASSQVPLHPPTRVERFVEHRASDRPARRAEPPVLSAPHAVEDDGWRLERLVAGRWYAIAGALIVTIGVALFFKLALDRGWLSFPPAARCLAGAAFGLVMLGIGEWIRRRTTGLRPSFQSFAPVGLNAAGIGCVYAAAFAAYGLYGLVGSAGGFVLLSATAALGIAVGARAKQVAVTVVSLIAGYGAPFLVAAPDPHPMVMPSYLLSLLIVGETICGWRGRRVGGFAVVRLVAWFGTVGIGTLWALAEGPSHLAVACSFIAAVWVVVHAELVWTVVRRGLTPIDWYKADLRPDWAAIRPYAVSLSTAGWATVLATALVRRWGGTEEWIPSAAAALACGGLGVGLARGVRAAISPRDDDAGRLGTLLVMQAGAAVIGAVALGLAGWAEVVAWMAMGLAGVAAGAIIRARGLQVYGLVVLAIAALRLTLYDAWAGELTTGGVHLAGLVLTRWSVLMASAGAAWILAGIGLGWGDWRALTRTGWRSAGEAAITTGVALLTASLFNPRAEAFSMMAALITAGVVLIGLAAVLRSTLTATAAFIAYAAAGVWIVGVGWFLRSTAGAGVELLGLHLTRYTALAAYASLAWFATARLLRVRALPDLGAPAPTICATFGAAWLAASIVHQDAALASISVAWAIMAVGLAAGRLIAPGIHLERIALTLLAFAIGLWIAAYPPYPAIDWISIRAWPAFSRPFVQGIGLATAVLAAAWMFAREHRALRAHADAAPDSGDDAHTASDRAETVRAVSGVCLAAAAAIVWLATTSEAARVAAPWSTDATARHAAASIWWGLFGVALIVAGFARRIPAVRHTGLALLGIATGKALVIDLGAVALEGRVASFIGLGLLMLGVAVLYARISARLRPASEVG